MASEIRVNKIENRSGLGTVTFADTGVDIAGITTAVTLKATTGIVTTLTATTGIVTTLTTNTTRATTGIVTTLTATTGIVTTFTTNTAQINTTNLTSTKMAIQSTATSGSGNACGLRIGNNVGALSKYPADLELRTTGVENYNAIRTDAGDGNGGFTAGTEGYNGFLNLTTGGTDVVAAKIRASGDSFFNGGDVAIGQTTADARLHIATPASTTCEIRLTSNNTGSGSGDRGRINVYSALNDGTAYQAGHIDIDRSSGTDDIAHLLVSLNDGSSVAERLRITGAGDLKFNSGYGSVTTVYGCRAWIQLNQSGSQSITGSGGVSSITDQGTGATQITFTNTMPDGNYSMVSGAQQSSDSSVNYGFSLCMQTNATTHAIIIYRPTATSDVKEDNSKIYCAFFR